MNTHNAILLRLEAGKRIGMGHLVRCLSLARQVRQVSGCGALIATTTDGAWTDRIHAEGFAHTVLSGSSWDEADAQGTAELVRNLGVRTVVTDYFGVHSEYIEAIRAAGASVLSVDDVGELINTADVIVNGSLVFSERAPSRGRTGTRFLCGPEYMILDPDFSETCADSKEGQAIREVLVTMGGSDPHGLSPVVVRALDAVGGDFRVRVVIGPAFDAHVELKRALVSARREMLLHSDVRNMPERIASCDLAITAGGITLYELCACGRPGMVIAQNEGQLAEAQAFDRAGAAISLGLWNRLSEENIATAIAEHLAKPDQLYQIGRQGRALVDGRGAARVAEEVISLWR